MSAPLLLIWSAKLLQHARASTLLLRRTATPDDDDDDADSNFAFGDASVAHLHALVPVVLDPVSTSYNCWCDLVLTLELYFLANHVLSDATHPGLPSWHQMDVFMLSWIFATVSVDLVDGMREHNGTACAAWLAIVDQFLGNRET